MKNKFFLITVAAALTACGGGGGGGETSTTAVAAPQPAPVATVAGDMTKYGGTWTSTCMPQGQQSVIMTLALGSNSTSASGRVLFDGYNQPDCTGPSVQMSVPFSATFVEMVGNAEKLNVTDLSETSTMLANFSVDGRTLSLSDDEETFVFTKK